MRVFSLSNFGENSRPLKYRADIDGLRAVAVSAVVVFHAFPALVQGGFLGVDVFFVISGYLISLDMFKPAKSDGFDFVGFYFRRVRRLFPALILVMASCCLFGWFALLPDEYAQLGRYVAAGGGGVSNIVLWNDAGYFDASAGLKPLLHLWSLGVEEQFYVFWPIVVWLAYQVRGGVLLLVPALVLISFSANVYFVRFDPVSAFYLPHLRFWELMCGSLIAWFQVCFLRAVDAKRIWGLRLERWFRRWRLADAFSAVGFFLLAYGFWRIHKGLDFPGVWALIPVLGAGLLISSGQDAFLNKHILSRGYLVWIGSISYPLYLWHWPLFSFSRIILGELPGALARCAIVLLSVLLAWVTYYFVESRLRFAGRVRRNTYLMLVLMLALSLMGLYIHQEKGLAERDSVVGQGVANAQFVGAYWAYSKNDSCLNSYPFDEAAKYAWWFCMKSSNRPPTIILMGNSFANQLYPGFARNDDLKGHTILSIGTCDFGGMDANPDPVGPCFGRRQRDQIEYIDQLISREKTIRYAIIDGLQSRSDEAYSLAVRQRIEKLRALGIRVIVFFPHLRPGFDPKSCVGRPFVSPVRSCAFQAQERVDARSDFQKLFDDISGQYPDVLFYDQNELYCRGPECSYMLNGIPLFRDEVHISEYASLKVQEKFSAWAKTHVPEIFAERIERRQR